MDYKEKLQDIINNDNTPFVDIDTFLKYFPELMESEDERIRKDLIQILQNALGVTQEWKSKVIAWLEKQCEQKPIIEMKSAEESLGIDSDTYNKIVDECIYGENKPTDKVEPKFHVGDWITNGIDFTFQIQSIEDNMYLRSDGYFIDIETADKKFRLWTIQDAKDGDVLVASDCSKFIYNGNITKSNSADFYIACTSNGSVVYGGDSEYGWEEKKSCHPATKEQRDTIMKAMTDAGYEWDAEKKS